MRLALTYLWGSCRASFGRMAAVVLLLLGTVLPAFAGHWEITIVGQGTKNESNGSDSRATPWSQTLSGKDAVYMGEGFTYEHYLLPHFLTKRSEFTNSGTFKATLNWIAEPGEPRPAKIRITERIEAGCDVQFEDDHPCYYPWTHKDRGRYYNEAARSYSGVWPDPGPATSNPHSGSDEYTVLLATSNRNTFSLNCSTSQFGEAISRTEAYHTVTIFPDLAHEINVLASSGGSGVAKEIEMPRGQNTILLPERFARSIGSHQSSALVYQSVTYSVGVTTLCYEVHAPQNVQAEPLERQIIKQRQIIDPQPLPDATVGQPYSFKFRTKLHPLKDEGPASVCIQWDPVPGAKAYRIYRTPARPGENSDLIGEGDSPFFDSNIKPGVTYTYAVTAVNACDAESPRNRDEVTVPEALVKGNHGQTAWGIRKRGDTASVVGIDSLPEGLVWDGESTIKGKPLRPGVYTFDVQLLDGDECKSVEHFVKLTVQPAPALSISTTTLPASTLTSSYQSHLSASGGYGEYVWDVIASSEIPFEW